MDHKEIIQFITNKILLSLNGSTHQESNKLDFKLQWYNLKEVKGKNEFLKDCCSIINSYGGGHGFIVIGYSDSSKNFKDANIIDSGYDDDRYLIDIIRSKVDLHFNIEVFNEHLEFEGSNKKISIIVIPPSLNKPHVITEYKEKEVTYLNEIFVRQGSTNQRASKGDLDYMYAEKTSLIIDKQLSGTIWKSSISKVTNKTPFSIQPDLIIENIGTKSIAIHHLTFELAFDDKDVFGLPVVTFILPYHQELWTIGPGEFKSFRKMNWYTNGVSTESSALLKECLTTKGINDVIDIQNLTVVQLNKELIRPTLIVR